MENYILFYCLTSLDVTQANDSARKLIKSLCHVPNLENFSVGLSADESINMSWVPILSKLNRYVEVMLHETSQMPPVRIAWKRNDLKESEICFDSRFFSHSKQSLCHVLGLIDIHRTTYFRLCF